MTDRAFGVELEDHKALIWSFARKGFARALALSLPFEVEDVFQEMCMTYVKAREKWNPEYGVTFSAYLGRSIWNEWNKKVERMMLDPARTSIDAMEDGMGDESSDGFHLVDVIAVEEATPDPVEQRERADFVLEQIRPMSRLAKLVIAELLCESGRKITTRDVAERHGFSEQEIKAARKEMREKWGASI